MFGGLGKSVRWAPALVAGGVMLGMSAPSSAADLGGDCCADLEERVAELEATTARKGNRKVSLEVSGHVNEAVMWWDDGVEQNVYVVGNDSGRSRFRLKGKAKISSDLSAGFRLELGLRTARSDRVDQGGVSPIIDEDDLVGYPDSQIDIRYSHWFIKSETYGQINVGWTESAAQSITEINLTQTKDIMKNADVEDWAAGFQLRASGIPGQAGLSNIEWRRLVNDDFIQAGEGNRGNLIQYISPHFAGFSIETSYGEDDYWDAALRYKGEFGGLKFAAGVAYSVNTDVSNPQYACIVSGVDTVSKDADCHAFGGSLSAIHEPTGLFLNAAAGWWEDKLLDERMPGADDTSTFYAFQGGIEQKWTHLGKTSIFGEYFHNDGSANDRGIDELDPLAIQVGFGDSRIWSSEMNVYGAGIIQGIDAAAMRMYLGWRHYENEVVLIENGTNFLANSPTEDLDVVMGGALIEF